MGSVSSDGILFRHEPRIYSVVPRAVSVRHTSSVAKAPPPVSPISPTMTSMKLQATTMYTGLSLLVRLLRDGTWSVEDPTLGTRVYGTVDRRSPFIAGADKRASSRIDCSVMIKANDLSDGEIVKSSMDQ